MSARGIIRVQVLGADLVVEIVDATRSADTTTTRLTIGDRFAASAEAYGISREVRVPRWTKLHARLLAALVLHRYEQEHAFISINELLVRWWWWFGRSPVSVGNQISKAFKNRDDASPAEDRRIVESNHISRGPYRINTAYDVEADPVALRCWLQLEEGPLEPAAELDAQVDACARKRDLIVALAHAPLDSRRYVELLRDLTGVELQLGHERALAHAQELVRTVEGHEQAMALRMLGIAWRQWEQFDDAIRAGEQARKMLLALRKAGGSAVERDLVVVEACLAESYLRRASRREGAGTLLVQNRSDGDWCRASTLLSSARQRAERLDDKQLWARVWASAARQRHRQRYLPKEHEATIEQARALRRDMTPYIREQFDRVEASAQLARHPGEDTLGHAVENLKHLVGIGLGQQARLAARPILIVLKRPLFQSSPFEGLEGMVGEAVVKAFADHKRCKAATRSQNSSASKVPAKKFGR